jgi:hypothetical protein
VVGKDYCSLEKQKVREWENEEGDSDVKKADGNIWGTERELT